MAKWIAANNAANLGFRCNAITPITKLENSSSYANPVTLLNITKKNQDSISQNDSNQMQADKPTIPEVLPIIKAYRDTPGNGAGGSLHAIFDDGNIRDSDIKWCIEYATKEGDKAGTELGQILLRMSKTQRNKLANMFYSA